MKLLFLTPNFEGYIGIAKHYYLEEVKRQAKVVAYGKHFSGYEDGKHVNDIMPDADAILYWQCATTPAGDIKGVESAKCPKIALLQNGHNYRDNQIKKLNDLGFDAALFPAWTETTLYYAERLKCPMIFHPTSIEPSVFKDYCLEKTVDVMTAGLVTPFYPLRHHISLTLKRMQNNGVSTLNLGHWGYKYDTHKRYSELKEKGFMWRDDYARAINKSRMFATDGGFYHAAVAKYYEAMACKSLLLAPRPFMADAYRFKDGENFVHVIASNLESKIQHYLKHDDERERIVDAAYQTVMQYHTNRVRVSQLLDIVEQLLNGYLIGGITFTGGD